ncbi:hypothetical protein [Streptomyces sp. NPDC050534]|uniref:hypothetical protein n=1 Tax=Streptomyces sp. NPDC050534 TaxID=3365625 RepID=UPI0037BB25E8
MSGPWLRYPARNIRQTRVCPSGEQRFPTAELALRSVPSGAHISLATTVCDRCDGVHLVRRTAA